MENYLSLIKIAENVFCKFKTGNEKFNLKIWNYLQDMCHFWLKYCMKLSHFLELLRWMFQKVSSPKIVLKYSVKILCPNIYPKKTY